MSDISIPGFSNSNSTIDTEQVIRDLVEVERIPINRLENDIDDSRVQKEIWQDVSRRIKALQDSADELYGFQTPFRSRIGISSNDNAIRVNADRGAEETTHNIQVKRLATADKLASDKIPASFRVAGGVYSFTIGDEKKEIVFSGGTIGEFASSINENGGDIISAQVVPIEDSSNVLLIQSNVTGKKNRIVFGGNALSLGIELGILEPTRLFREQLDGSYSLQPQQEQIIEFANRYSLEDGAVISYQASISDSPTTHIDPFNLDSNGSVSYQGVTIFNSESFTPFVPQPAIEPYNDFNEYIAVTYSDGSKTILSPAVYTDTQESYHIELAPADKTIVGIALTNENTDTAFDIDSISVASASSNSAHAKNPISTADDAIVNFDGIDISRASNRIDDLIPSASIELLQDTTVPVETRIQPDYDRIKNSIIRLVANYNELIRDINIYTRNDSTVIAELDYLEQSERELASQRLGSLDSETSLEQLRSRLINIVQNPYDTSAGDQLQLLIQLGIGSNVDRESRNSVDFSRLRGYLEMDEDVFDSKLREHFSAVQELFGSDTDGDIAIDTGIAYLIDTYANLFTRVGGVIESKINSIDSNIERDTASVTTYTNRLERYEDNLRRDFGEMQSALESLDDSTRAIESINSTNNN